MILFLISLISSSTNSQILTDIKEASALLYYQARNISQNSLASVFYMAEEDGVSSFKSSSCDMWQGFRRELIARSTLYEASNITLQYRGGFEEKGDSFNFTQNYYCNDTDKVRQIVSNLIRLDADVDAATDASFKKVECQGMHWFIQVCPNINANRETGTGSDAVSAAICVGTTEKRCNHERICEDSHVDVETALRKTIAPCYSSNERNRRTRILSVLYEQGNDFGKQEKAMVKNVSVISYDFDESTMSGVLGVSVDVDLDGVDTPFYSNTATVFCIARPETTLLSSPSSSVITYTEILSQKFSCKVNQTISLDDDADDYYIPRCSLQISDVLAASRYGIFCTCQSKTDTQDFVDTSAIKKIEYYTPGVPRVQFITSANTFEAGVTINNAANLYVNAALEDPLHIFINSKDSSGIQRNWLLPMTLTLPPGVYTRANPIPFMLKTFDSLQENNFETVNIEYEIYFESGSLSDLRFQSMGGPVLLLQNFDDSFTTRLYLKNAVSLPPPSSYSLQWAFDYQNANDEVLMKFNQPTNRAGLPNSFFCDKFLQIIRNQNDENIASFYICSWITNSLLRIRHAGFSSIYSRINEETVQIAPMDKINLELSAILIIVIAIVIFDTA